MRFSLFNYLPLPDCLEFCMQIYIYEMDEKNRETFQSV